MVKDLMTGDFTKKKVAVYKSKMPVDGDDAADKGGRAEEGAEKKAASGASG